MQRTTVGKKCTTFMESALSYKMHTHPSVRCGVAPLPPPTFIG